MKKIGLALFILIALFPSCRTSTPPVIEICITKATGGADCRERDGSHVFKPPSQMDNYWCTNQVDEAAFAGWAYDAPVPAVKKSMNKMAIEIHAAAVP